ncbi:MAG: hypothetical protein JWR84_522 [Caulobacter sp.]|nr:hypothetical protein [Caulobacter sp.]
MTDTVSVARPHEDRVIPLVIYGLYFIGPLTGFLTTLIGLIIAYAQRGGAGARMESHYTMLIRTFWLAIGWTLVAVALVIVGGLLTPVLVGIPALVLGLAIFGVFGPVLLVWKYIRLVLGASYLARDEAYPRPMSWLF